MADTVSPIHSTVTYDSTLQIIGTDEHNPHDEAPDPSSSTIDETQQVLMAFRNQHDVTAAYAI